MSFPLCQLYRGSKLRVGLLGGSFNPAHDGHRYISLEAMKRLGLDEVWWLVTEQNPLKASERSRPLDKRLNEAKAMVLHPRIKVMAIEQYAGSRYTVDTLRYLKAALPNIHWVWLMGADNLVQLPRWRRWLDLCQMMPIAVFDRYDLAYQALAGQSASRFRSRIGLDRHASNLPCCTPPRLCYLRIRPHPQSSTKIRAGRKWWQIVLSEIVNPLNFIALWRKWRINAVVISR